MPYTAKPATNHDDEMYNMSDTAHTVVSPASMDLLSEIWCISLCEARVRSLRGNMLV